MKKLVDGILYDAQFIKSHTLQPKWWKIGKIFLILGFVGAYFYLFGWVKTIVFFTAFMLFNLTLHMVYRVKTKKFKQSWLDFIVFEEDGVLIYQKIGKYYYAAIVVNTILSICISLLLF